MEQSELGAMKGYLLLADISGYTGFLTGTELEHSHAIVTELTKLIRSALVPPLRFVKLEGDAVFCFADADAFPNAEQLVELVESCYFDFSSRLLDMERSTTCKCDACRAIGDLDLKFVAHFGSFIVDRDEDGRIDLCGPDVILAHRLLKNTIIESGGPSAYGFFTTACLTQTSAEFRLPPHTESYESFDEVTGVVQDLAAVAQRRRESQRVRITGEDADVETAFVIDAPPAVVWQYMVQPDKRARWASIDSIETSVVFSPNDEGRLATGASSHCAHSIGGDALREYLDWRPYEYFTCRLTPLPAELVILCPWVETWSLSALDDNRTEFRHAVRSTDRSVEGMAKFETLAAGMRERASQPDFGAAVRAAIAEDAAAFAMDEATT